MDPNRKPQNIPECNGNENLRLQKIKLKETRLKMTHGGKNYTHNLQMRNSTTIKVVCTYMCAVWEI